MHHILCSFLEKHQITQVTQHPLQPRFGTLWLVIFPKTKITYEREEISDHQRASGKHKGQLMETGRTVWGPKVPALKGTEASLSYVQCFLYPLQQISLFFTLRGWIPSVQISYVREFLREIFPITENAPALAGMAQLVRALSSHNWGVMGLILGAYVQVAGLIPAHSVYKKATISISLTLMFLSLLFSLSKAMRSCPRVCF